MATNDSIVFPDTEDNRTIDVNMEEDMGHLKSNLDHLFLIVMGAIILFMQAGFALIEVGTVRTKNATSILIKNISDMCFGKNFAPLVLSYFHLLGVSDKIDLAKLNVSC